MENLMLIQVQSVVAYLKEESWTCTSFCYSQFPFHSLGVLSVVHFSQATTKHKSS